MKINAEHIRRGAALRVALEKKVRENAEKKKDKDGFLYLNYSDTNPF